jgi:hypothetical protein
MKLKTDGSNIIGRSVAPADCGDKDFDSCLRTRAITYFAAVSRPSASTTRLAWKEMIDEYV